MGALRGIKDTVMSKVSDAVVSPVKGLKYKVIDKTSDALSFPSRAISDSKSRVSTALHGRMKMVNDTPSHINDGGPNRGKPSRLFMARNEMRSIKMNQTRALQRRKI